MYESFPIQPLQNGSLVCFPYNLYNLHALRRRNPPNRFSLVKLPYSGAVAHFTHHYVKCQVFSSCTKQRLRNTVSLHIILESCLNYKALQICLMFDISTSRFQSAATHVTNIRNIRTSVNVTRSISINDIIIRKKHAYN